jgi:hypothetical protein
MTTSRSVAANRRTISCFIHCPSLPFHNALSSKAWCRPLGEAANLTFTTFLVLLNDEKWWKGGGWGGGCTAIYYPNKFLNIQVFWDMTPCRLVNSSWRINSKRGGLKLKQDSIHTRNSETERGLNVILNNKEGRIFFHIKHTSKSVSCS